MSVWKKSTCEGDEDIYFEDYRNRIIQTKAEPQKNWAK
jgi:hypothetical protein